RLRDELRSTGEDVRPLSRLWFILPAHLLAFAGFTVLTAFVLGEGARFAAFPEAWIALWMATGVLSLGLWCLLALPVSQWLHLLRRCRFVFVGGIGVGLAAGLAGWLTDRLWQPLSQGTLWIVHSLLQLTGAQTVCRPSEFLVGTSTFSVAIEPACSGYEGVGLVCVF